VLTHTWPCPPPGAGGLAASSVVRPAGIGRAGRRGFLLAFAFLEVGFALGEAVGDAAGEVDAAFSVGAGDAEGVGVATVGVSIVVGVSIATGQFSRVGLFVRHWATPKTIATVTEAIPAAIAQRARRWVC
jgi:TRAP-type uncharacterized transport system fused permease subunit